jgi:hypothetical protein
MDALARGLLGAGKGEMVRYHDGNPLNLRLNNLRLVSRRRVHTMTNGGAA